MKSLQITPEMQVRINAAAGTEVDPASITVFEAISLTDRPIKKKGSIFEGATLDPNMFNDLAAFLAANNGTQLMLMHETGDLPTGRVFYAAPSPEGLRSQFYIPNKDNAKLINDVETGVVGDVSMGMLAQHLLCSVCQFDYRGDTATIDNLYNRTCANDHTIGTDGVHLVLKGIEAWSELSLCGQGASPGAKIVSRMRAALKNSTSVLESLAASGMTPEAVTLSTTPLAIGDDMSKELIDKVEAQAVQLTAANTAKSAAESSVAELTGKLSTAEASVAELNTKVSAAETAKTEALTAKATAEQALTTANTTLSAHQTYIKEQAEKAMIQLGLKASDVPADFDGQIAKINEAGATLAHIIAAGGKAKSIDGGAAASEFTDPSAFSVRPSTTTA